MAHTMNGGVTEQRAGGPNSGYLALFTCQHFARERNQLQRVERIGKKDNPVIGIFSGRFAAFAQHQHAKVWLSRTKFGDKTRCAKAVAVEPTDDKVELAGELRLLQEAKSFGGVECALQLAELTG